MFYYVMLSRCCSLNQLHILGKMNTDKIRVDKKVVKEAKRMWRVYLNANPDKWANAEMKVLRITSLNYGP